MISQTRSIKFTYLLLILCTSLFLSSCGCDEDCAEFSNFRMCDSAPTADGCADNTNTFAQDADNLTVSVEIKNGEPEDRLSIKYFIQDGNSFTEFFTLSESLKNIDEDVDGSERKIRASTGVSRNVDRLWPIGEYKVEIELTQENIPLNETQNFSVQ